MRTMPARPWGRFAAGVGIWAAAFGAVAIAAAAHGGELRRPAAKLERFVLSREHRLKVELRSPWAVEPGDPLLAAGDRRSLGRVVAVDLLATDPLPAPIGTESVALIATCTYAVTIAIDPEADADAVARAPLAIKGSPGDMKWILETLLPPPKRDAVKKEIDAFLAENGDTVAAALRPIGDELLQHSMGVLEKNLAAALKKREPEVKRVLDKNRAIVKQDLLPVLKAQLGPSAKEKLKPILTQIGRELWDELPIWSVSWRALVDSLPGQRKSYIDEWWHTFLEDKAIPIVKSHEDDLVKFAEQLVEEGARDAKVRESIAVATRKLAQDPEFKALVRGVFEDAVIKNFDARDLYERIAKNPDHRRRLDAVEKAFAPHLQRIARTLAIEPGTGRLDPDLARVLRRVVFKKDQRWVEADLGIAGGS